MNYKVKDVANIIEEFAPLSLQGDFDNCGLNVGDKELIITGILITLDTNVDVVEEAIAKKCNLIIEHHPIIFAPIKHLTTEHPKNKAIILAIKNDIAIYSAHTNVDYTDDGLNDYVVKLLGGEDIYCAKEKDSARIATLKKPMTLRKLEESISTILKDTHTASIGDPEQIISKIGCINGGGGGQESALWDVRDTGADIFITSDIKYNVARLAKDLNYAIIYYGHYDSEIFFIELISKLLHKELDNLSIIASERCANPYNNKELK